MEPGHHLLLAYDEGRPDHPVGMVTGVEIAWTFWAHGGRRACRRPAGASAFSSDPGDAVPAVGP